MIAYVFQKYPENSTVSIAFRIYKQNFMAQQLKN